MRGCFRVWTRMIIATCAILVTLFSLTKSAGPLPWNNCSKTDCRTLDCSSHQLTRFDCPPGTSPESSIQKILLQNNLLSYFSTADTQNCFPNIRFINLFANPLQNLECGSLTTKLETVFNCTDKSRICSPLAAPICCCFKPFERPRIDPCPTSLAPSTSTPGMTTFGALTKTSSSPVVTTTDGQKTDMTSIASSSEGNTTQQSVLRDNDSSLILAVTIPVTAVVLCIAIALSCWYRKRRQVRSESSNLSEGEVVIFERGRNTVRSQSTRLPKVTTGPSGNLRRTASLKFSHRPPPIEGIDLTNFSGSFVHGSITQRNPPIRMSQESNV